MRIAIYSVLAGLACVLCSGCASSRGGSVPLAAGGPGESGLGSNSRGESAIRTDGFTAQQDYRLVLADPGPF